MSSSSSSASSEDGEQPFSAAALAAQALRCVDSCNPELAAQFFERALQVEPANCDVLDEYADLLLAVGNVAKGAQMLQRSIAAAPEAAHAKYFNLGQISEGADALQCFEKGLTLLERQLQTAQEPLRQMLAREKAAAHVSIAELFMSDLCFAPDAEQRCQQAVELACQADPLLADAHHTMASFYISKGDNVRALQALNRGYALWKPKDEDDDNDEDSGGKMDIDGNHDDDDGSGHGEDDENRPLYSSRLAAGKMFLELNDAASAADIVSDLILENEDDPELYFLMGLSSEEAAERKDWLDQALERIEKCEKAGETDLEHLKKAVLNALSGFEQQ